MTIIELGAAAYAAQLDAAGAVLDLLRVTSVPEGATAGASFTIECGSTDAVDAIAAQWDARACWLAGGRQYCATISDTSRHASAMAFFIPVPRDGQELPERAARSAA